MSLMLSRFENSEPNDEERSLGTPAIECSVDADQENTFQCDFTVAAFLIERALEAAALMLGSDKSRGYCLEMICADFLAGVSLETGNQDALVLSLTRLVIGLPKPQRKQLLENVQVTL
jgi:hypothetical protein